MQRIKIFACAVLGALLLMSSGCEERGRDTETTTRAQVALPPCPKAIPPWRVSGKCILQDK